MSVLGLFAALVGSGSMVLDRALQPVQAQLAQTQAQLTLILSKLDEVPRLSGSVERLNKDVDAVLRKELKN